MPAAPAADGFDADGARRQQQERRWRNQQRRSNGPPPKVARAALQLFAPGAASWVSPAGVVRVALCFFGKIGTLVDPSSYTAADGGDEATVRLAHASIKRNVLDANPRVKNREKFRRATIKRKGQVREVREAEGGSYAGEASGIRKGVSHSRKFAK